MKPYLANSMRTFFKFIIISVVCINLTACIAIAVTAIGATAIVKRKVIRQTLSDHDISFSVSNAIYANKKLYANNHIVTTVYHGQVLLVGQVITKSYRQEAVSIVQNVTGVKRIYDQLTIQQPTSQQQRAIDNGITSAINQRMPAIKGSVEITTENGIVYLMGSVTREDAEKATNLARTVSGVKKVVTIFNYLPVNA
jgi:osmotically-inducible protein OsmY